MKSFENLFQSMKLEKPDSCFLFAFDGHFYAFGSDAQSISSLTKQGLYQNQDMPELIQASTCFPIEDLSYYFQLFSIELCSIVIKNPALGLNPADNLLYAALQETILSRSHCSLNLKTA